MGSTSGSANVESDQSPHTNSPSPFNQLSSSGLENNKLDVGEVTAPTKGSHIVVKWQWEEDESLLCGWLNVGQDPVVEDNKPIATFWDRIYQYCLYVDPECFSKKNANSLKQLFFKIHTAVSVFCRFYKHVERHQGSGTNEHNVLEMAHTFYRQTYPSRFNMMLHLNLLHHQPKWRNHLNSSDGYMTSSTGAADVEFPVHPHGRDATKRKVAKRKSSKGLNVAATELDKAANIVKSLFTGIDDKYDGLQKLKKKSSGSGMKKVCRRIEKLPQNSL
ncbi:hypothetical protein CRG98_047202 [Punica granatum]|uniref:No apical meristem-associated C-terminal domain-containing protein n=1 Tax=Punica granatum TaxID=22663 RepID=A0A2I0HL20_PUNGR|nr:hypothetical protein CRG98_047202 [Punica granatum]